MRNTKSMVSKAVVVENNKERSLLMRRMPTLIVGSQADKPTLEELHKKRTSHHLNQKTHCHHNKEEEFRL